MPDARRRRRIRRRGRWLAAGAVVVLAAAGGTAWALTRSSGPSYRVALVQYASVAQSVDAVGTVGAVNRAVVSFPVSGQVATVPVTLGEHVRAGQVLATLSTVALQQQLTQADQTLADNQQRLANDQSGQTGQTAAVVTASSSVTSLGTDSAGEQPLGTPGDPAGTPSGSSGKGSGSTGSGGAGGSGAGHSGTGSGERTGSGLTAAVAAVQAAQAKLTGDQKALDAILSDDSLQQLLGLTKPSGACAAGPDTTQLTATTDTAGTITVTTGAPATITAGAATVGPPAQSGGTYTYVITGTPGTGYPLSITEQVVDASACTAAIGTLVTDLDPSPDGSAWALAQSVSGDELQLQKAITTLEQLAARAASASGGASTSPGGTSSGRSGTGTGGSRTGATSGTGSSTRAGTNGTSTGSGARGGSGTGGTVGETQTITPEQVAADQAAVDSAQAQVAVAKQDLDRATITSPIAGTVADVELTAGSNAGSNAVTVIGAGAYEVSTTVPLSEIDAVKTGDRTTVSVDGIATPLTGTVSQIGVLTSTSGSSTAYPVTVLLDPSSARLFDGAGAAVTIAVGSVAHVLTVPSSAVHTLGTGGSNALATVSVLSGGTIQATRVGVGVTGTDRTQITSGLTAGEQVVLAQLDAPLPSSTNPLAGLRGTGLGGGGLGGGGLGGGRGGAGAFTGARSGR